MYMYAIAYVFTFTLTFTLTFTFTYRQAYANVSVSENVYTCVYFCVHAYLFLYAYGLLSSVAVHNAVRDQPPGPELADASILQKALNNSTSRSGHHHSAAFCA